MVELLGLIVLAGSPVAAGIIAGSYARGSDEPGSAQRRGLWATWGLGIAFGIAGGFVIDLLFMGDGGYMVPAFVANGMIQFFVSGVAAIIVGRRCAQSVRGRKELR